MCMNPLKALPFLSPAAALGVAMGKKKPATPAPTDTTQTVVGTSSPSGY